MAANFNAPVTSRNILAGISTTHGGIFNAYMHDSAKNIESSNFLVSLSLQEVEEAKFYVARETELRELGELLQSGQRRPTAILQGPEGAGKTQLACQYILSLSEEKKYSAVIWLNAKDETSLKKSFKLAAAHIFQEQSSWVELNNAVNSGKDDDIVKTVKEWLGLPNNDKWLLVFDGYSGSEDAPNPYSIRDFYPSTLHGSIIITTRLKPAGFGESVKLRPLSKGDSLKFLKSASGKDVDNNAAAESIAEKLTSPIELSAIVAFIKESDVNVSWEDCLERCKKVSWNWRDFAARNGQT